MSNYKINQVVRGLYHYETDEFGRGYWLRVATYPPHLKSLRAVLDWYEQQEVDQE